MSSGSGAFRTFISRHCGLEMYSFKNKVRFSGNNLYAAAIALKKKKKKVQTKTAVPVTAHKPSVSTGPYTKVVQSG